MKTGSYTIITKFETSSRIENKSIEDIHNLDTLIAGITDVGIALWTAVAAAESFGLGTVAIRKIRRTHTPGGGKLST